VSLSGTAPALQVLYLIMFQVAAYPIAISIRTTNVYEDRSLGVFEDDTESEVEDRFAAKLKLGDEGRVTSSYVGYHLRKQLAFDQWWLAAALFFRECKA
jgi:Trk-type K+ transport system membrane component